MKLANLLCCCSFLFLHCTYTVISSLWWILCKGLTNIHLMATCCHNSHSLAFFLSLFAFHILTLISQCFRSCPFPLRMFFCHQPYTSTHTRLSCIRGHQSPHIQSAVFTHSLILPDCQLRVPVKVVTSVSCLFTSLLLTCSFSGLRLSLICLNHAPACWISSCLLDVCSLPVCLPQSNQLWTQLASDHNSASVFSILFSNVIREGLRSPLHRYI